jgi:streptogramin lyase
MWISASSSKFGALYRLKPVTGEVLSKHEVAIGIEDLSFDPEGSLWTVSEAGSRRWAKWSQTFPVIFRIDVTKLKPD